MVGSFVLICYLSLLVPHPFKYPKVVKHVHVGPENSYGKGQSTFARNGFTRFAVTSLRNTNLISYLTLYYLLIFHNLPSTFSFIDVVLPN